MSAMWYYVKRGWQKQDTDERGTFELSSCVAYNTGRDTTRYLDNNVKCPEVISGYIRYKASPDKIFDYTAVHGEAYGRL